MVKTVCNVKSEPVYIKLFYPAFYTFKNVIYNLFIFEIELYKIIVTFPAFIPKTVIVT